MFLARIKLTNFRGFESFEMTLDPRLTVLVGANGTGKSSLLQAIVVAASRLVAQAFGQDRYGAELHTDDLREGQTIGEIETTWDSPRLTHKLRFEAPNQGPLQEIPSIDAPPSPPLYIVLSTERSRTRADKSRGTMARGSVRSQRPAWDDDLNDGFLQFEQLLTWFREREDIENQMRVQDRESFGRTDPALDAVRRAVTKVLGDEYGVPRIDRTQGTRLMIKKRGVDLSAEQLSDGERSQLILAATLARRLFLLDKTAVNPLEQNALVLIDEVELHLHPAWQRQILATLLGTFPKVQFVVSTHSVSVLSAVKSSQVRILENFKAYDPGQPVFGRDANAILEDLLGVPSRPDEVQEKIREISSLLDQGSDLDARSEAKAQLSALEGVVGADDSEVIRLRLLLEFLAPVPDDDQAAEGA